MRLNTDEAVKVSFGIIVLNGEPFTRYCLRALYPFAHEIIVVEGASKHAAAVATPDGHSTDGTLETLRRFKAEEDSEHKVQIVTREGFWSEKDEQSQAYAERATGDYLWQVDIDEFYHHDDLEKVLAMIAADPGISGMAFHWKNFWGGFEYLVDGWGYRDIIRGIGGNRRLFRWGKGCRYVSHRPPTVIDEQGRDLCTLRWIGPDEIARHGIFCYHYGMIFPKQAEQKSHYYHSLQEQCRDMDQWRRDSFVGLRHPFRILHGMRSPSWLSRFQGTHPEVITSLTKDMEDHLMTIDQRPTDDIAALVGSWRYRTACFILHYLYFVVSTVQRLLHRVKQVVESCVKRPMRWSATIVQRLSTPPLESLPFVPDLFRAYRKWLRHPDLQRQPGGWRYRGRFYPDYLTVGGASQAITQVALKYCQGSGLDVGAGFWPLSGSRAVDLERGPGKGFCIADFQDGSLDYIFSSHCLEHIDQWKYALTEWLRKIKTGGILFLYLPHPDCEIWHPGSPFVGTGHKWIPTPVVVKQALLDLKCTIIDADDGPDTMCSFYICCRKG
jgi:SAM-dependent methyltransferase